VNGKTKKEFRIITIIIFGRYIKFNLNNNMYYPTAITAGEKIIKL
jgi:low affinity Fe/Cu permease